MNIETLSRTAFELVAEAVGEIDFYKHSRDRERLLRARRKLDLALQKDQRYLQAHFYSGVVDDLIGRTKPAIQSLQEVLAAIPEERMETRNQVRYNLAVAIYHGYGRDSLARAAEHFRAVLESSENLLLRCLAEAGLAQTYAMGEIPPNPDERSLEEQHLLEDNFINSNKMFESVQAQLARLAEAGVPESTRREIEGVAWNAQGMALMYYSDFHGERRSELLDKARLALEQAGQFIPFDWANTCDQASCLMRLGYWASDAEVKEKYLAEARRLLQTVVDTLRPGYPFAKYEIGRAYRLEGKFNEALKLFEEAKAVPKAERDVSDRRIDREIGLARECSTSYP